MSQSENPEKLFILNAPDDAFGDQDEAIPLETAYSEDEAKDLSSDYDELDGIWMEYDVDSNGEMSNPKQRFDILAGEESE